MTDTVIKDKSDRLSQVMVIEAGVDFAAALATGLLDQFARPDDPLALGRVTLLLPTRRAVRTMRDAFLKITDGKPVILPMMRPFGDVSDEDLIIGAAASNGGRHAVDLPPAIDPLERQASLAKLIKAWFERQGDTPTLPLCLDLAAALGRFLDLAAMEHADMSKLPTLMQEDRFAEHWQQVMGFLDIIRVHWPEFLKQAQAIDAGTRRDAMIRALADQWHANPPTDPVIAAGSTGSIPATAQLLTQVSRLPQGHVILPGLDLGMDDDSWQAMSESHPQYGLRELLRGMDIDRKAVTRWPYGESANRDRSLLWRAAMRPAETADKWRAAAIDLAPRLSSALDGLTCLAAPDPQTEATGIALAMREMLETPGATATLITPDRQLARRVTAALGRWGLQVDDSAGLPLTDSTPARFIMMIAETAANGFAPAHLLALLKHPYCRLENPVGVTQLERYALRGPRPAPGLQSLKAAIDHLNEKDDKAITKTSKALTLLQDLTVAFAPLSEADNQKPSHLVTQLITCAEQLSNEADAALIWTGDAGEALSRTLAHMMASLDALGPLSLQSLPGVLRSCLAGNAVRPRIDAHPRLKILGPLEARLQQADLTILAGLNEGVWPRQSANDPWLSRPMRKAFGLPQPERQTGLSAHDFVQAASGGKVLLTWSAKRDGAPSAPSRFISRLETLLDAADAKLADIMRDELIDWAGELDRLDKPRPKNERPSPRPPVSARPQKLSVTQIETLLRNPYDIYARHVLHLKKLDDIDQNVDAAERGTILHDIMEQFINDVGQGALPKQPEQARTKLDEIARARFGDLLTQPGIRAFWWPRYEAMADFAIETIYEQAADTVKSFAECYGELTLPLADKSFFTLSGRADRIDQLRDGTYRIVDYKTGNVPSNDQVIVGFASQLPLEALMVQQGAFKSSKADGEKPIDPLPVSVLEYWKFAARTTDCSIKSPPGKDIDLSDFIQNVSDNLVAMLSRYRSQTEPYMSRPYPHKMTDYSDYDHLARVREWTTSGEGEE